MKIGFIGIGNMGSLMAANLVAKGYSVTAYDLMPKALEAAASAGAAIAPSPAGAASGAEVVITMLPQSSDTENALFGPEGAAGALRPGAVVIDMGTGSPTLIRAMAARLKETGIDLLDAPVSGGVQKATADESATAARRRGLYAHG